MTFLGILDPGGRPQTSRHTHAIGLECTVCEACDGTQKRVPNSSKKRRQRACFSYLLERCNESETPSFITYSENTAMAKIFHPVLALIASGTDRALAKYVEFLKEENKILRARVPGQVHTKPDERLQLL